MVGEPDFIADLEVPHADSFFLLPALLDSVVLVFEQFLPVPVGVALGVGGFELLELLARGEDSVGFGEGY